MAHILHLLHSYLPDSRGGIETHVEQLAASQVAAGDRVTVVAASDRATVCAEGPALHRERDADPAVLLLPTETEIDRFQRDASANLARFAALLDELRPDLLHVHHFAPVGPGAVVAAKARSIPTVVTVHDLFTACPLYFRLRRDRELCAAEVDAATCTDCLSEASGVEPERIAAPFERRTAAYRDDLLAAAAVLPISRTLLDYLRRVPLLRGVRLESIGFPAAPPAPDGPLELRLPDLPLQVASWGGLVRGKGMHLLVEAARSLPPGSIDLHHHGGVIDADYRAELEAAAGPVALTFHGHYAPTELRRRLLHCDLAVQPSLFLETHGFTTDEALRLGLPVLVPDRGAPQERIGRRGRTFRVDDVGDLARQLGEFVAHPERLLSLRAGEPGELLDLDGYLERLLAIYARARG